jgi:hypothetical protein
MKPTDKSTMQKGKWQVFTREEWFDVTDIEIEESSGLLAVGYTHGFLYVNNSEQLRFLKDKT